MAEKQRILIVDDDANIAELISLYLMKECYETMIVGDGEEALKVFPEFKPNLVLLDLNLPEVSGFQICRDIKRRSALPVLVLTSRDQLRDEVHALELGADEYLTKPYRKERLLARIGNVLKRYEGRPNLLEGADFLLDRQTYTLYIHNQSVVLPPTHVWRMKSALPDSASGYCASFASNRLSVNTRPNVPQT